jgi:hypothetical protein
MTEATADFLARLRDKTGPQKTVWCQHSSAGAPGPNDEHQVCIDIGAGFERDHPGEKWSCPCRCHR